MIIKSLVIVGLLCIVRNCNASFTFTLTVLSHTTSGSCDIITSCDTYFSIFCLRGSSTGRSTDLQNCPLGFNGRRLNTQSGTRTISSLQPWQTNFQLFIQAFDEDFGADDFLDNIFIEGTLNDSTSSPVTTVSGSRSRVTMRVQFRRVCQANYYNVNCSTFCLEADDKNRGHYTCNERDGSKLCLQGYEGVDCLENSSDCSSNPCNNGATCMDSVEDYMCICLPGYTSKNCSENIDDCQDAECSGNSSLPNPCESYPCTNGGTCTAQDLDHPQCVCPAGFTGTNCNALIKEDCQDCPPEIQSGAIAGIVLGILAACSGACIFICSGYMLLKWKGMRRKDSQHDANNMLMEERSADPNPVLGRHEDSLPQVDTVSTHNFDNSLYYLVTDSLVSANRQRSRMLQLIGSDQQSTTNANMPLYEKLHGTADEEDEYEDMSYNVTCPEKEGLIYESVNDLVGEPKEETRPLRFSLDPNRSTLSAKPADPTGHYNKLEHRHSNATSPLHDNSEESYYY